MVKGKVSDAALDALARVTATASLRGAASYLQLNNVDVTDFAAASQVIREETEARLDEALRDAKAALEIGMVQVAEATFRASMLEAGIAAGKRIQQGKL